MGSMQERALRRALARPRCEIIPIRGALEQARLLPPGATVTVTCSPSKGVAATLDLAEQLHALGYRPVPHLAARRIESFTHLDRVLARVNAIGVQDVFIVGGDGMESSGPFCSGGELIRAITETQAPLQSIGIPCYPEGHSSIPVDALDAALEAKSAVAAYMVTQICFDARSLLRWLHSVRERGISLPVYIGIPGMIERRKLMAIALRIGLGDSARFLKKNAGMLSRLAGPTRFTPDTLIDGLTDALTDATFNVAGFHINTFNQVADSEAWREAWLNMLDAACPEESGVSA